MKNKYIKYLPYIALLLVIVSLIGCAPPAEVQNRPMNSSEFIMNTVMFFLMALAVYYLLVLKPEGEKDLKQRKFIEKLSKNDQVVTSGGIHGRVVSSKEGIVNIEIAQNVRIKVDAKHVKGAENTNVNDTAPVKDNKKRKNK